MQSLWILLGETIKMMLIVKVDQVVKKHSHFRTCKRCKKNYKTTCKRSAYCDACKKIGTKNVHGICNNEIKWKKEKLELTKNSASIQH